MDRQSRLDAAITSIQDRWGVKALHKLKALVNAEEILPIPTGFADLDTLLNGGIRVGCITELVGKPTSGMTTLALKLMASVHAMGEVVVYLDTCNTFDPDYAVRCGVKPDQLVTALPQSPAEGVEILYDLVSQRAARLIMVSSSVPLLLDHTLANALPRLRRRLAKSGCALVFLTPLTDVYSPVSPLPQDAETRLQVTRQAWLGHGADVEGYQIQVTILKQKPRPPGGSVRLDICFAETVRGDAT